MNIVVLIGDAKRITRQEDDLSKLKEGRKAVRESALSSLVGYLTNNVDHDFANEYFVTFLFDCLWFLGANKSNNNAKAKEKAWRMRTRTEIQLSLRALGLLAMNMHGNKDNSHEVFEESLPFLARALERFHDDQEIMLMLIDCLALVAFFGCSHPHEIQTVMRMIWDSSLALSSNNNNATRAISTWSFVLSGSMMQRLPLSSKYWNHVISDLMDLLNSFDDNDIDIDTSMIILAMADALGLIIEVDAGFSNKFSRDQAGVMLNIIKQKTNQDKLWWDDLAKQGKEGDNSPDNSDKVFNLFKLITTSVQTNFLKGFLGVEGLTKHIQENDNLVDLRKIDDDHHYSDYDNMPDRVKTEVMYDTKLYQFHVLPSSKRAKQIQKRMMFSPSSHLNKARSILRKKQRELSNNIVLRDSDDETF